MVNPKITVIIPTRARCDVLEYSLRTVTAQDYDNLEIIVSDNCSNDDTEGVVRRANDPRIRYLNTDKRLSMSHNWEFALSHVEDGWVTFIGDDDGLMPEAIGDVAEILGDTDVKAIRSTCCEYKWPAVAGNDCGQLIVPMSTGIEVRESSPWLRRVMRGVVKYPQLPMIYNGGFACVSALNKAKAQTGAFFRSCSPDVYSAVALASVVDHYLYLRKPLAVSGVSRHSTGNSAHSVSKGRNPLPVSVFYSEENIPFHTALPLQDDGSVPISFQALVYEAYLQSRFLRDEAAGENYRQQLEIIMATSGIHRQSVELWGQKFAKAHELDFAEAKRIAALKRLWLQMLSESGKVANALHTTFADDLPVRDIHGACIAAGVIRSRPGSKGAMRFLARELLRRFGW